MKKITIILFMYLSILVPGVSSDEVWRITSLNWEPYSGAVLFEHGKSIQLLKSLLKSKGINLIVDFFPWKRSQEKAKSNKYIGYFPAWPEEVQKGFVRSPPIDWSEIGLLIKKDSKIKYTNLEEIFKAYRVGHVKTYKYPEPIASLIKKYSLTQNAAPSDRSLVKMLHAGRIEVAVTDPNVMIHLANQIGYSNIEILKNIMKKELVIALRDSEDNKTRIELINGLFKKVNQ